MEKGVLHFKIGEGLSDLVRNAFWYELRFDWAMRTFECFEGLSHGQIIEILMGNATLKPIEDGTRVELVKGVDMVFQNKLAKHVIFIKEKIEKLVKEVYQLETDLNKVESSIFPGDYNSMRIRLLKIDLKILKDKKEALYRLLHYYDEFFGKKVVPQTTTKVGDYEVPNNLLDEYCNDVVRRIRMSLKTGMIAIENPLEMVGLEQRRRELHDKILVAVGFVGAKRKGDKYHEFSKALESFLEDMGAGLYDKKKR